MKKIITSALVLALTIGAAQAQSTTQEKQKGHEKEHKMHKLDGLNLTEDQKAKIKALHEQQKKEMQENKSATKEQKMELRKKYKAEFEAILTPEQKQQMDKIKEERKTTGEYKRDGKARKGGFDSTRVGKKDGFRRGGDFGKELGLSQEQQEKMGKIRADFKPRFEALRNDKLLSDEQKKSKFQELMKAQQEQTKTVLTKEQIEKLQSMRKERSERSTK